MTAQQKGMQMVSACVREIVPPQLDFVVLIYKPSGDITMSSVGHSRKGQTNRQTYERMRVAAQAFLDIKPDAEFFASEN